MLATGKLVFKLASVFDLGMFCRLIASEVDGAAPVDEMTIAVPARSIPSPYLPRRVPWTLGAVSAGPLSCTSEEPQIRAPGRNRGFLYRLKEKKGEPTSTPAET
jgi:hypothetical protein